MLVAMPRSPTITVAPMSGSPVFLSFTTPLSVSAIVADDVITSSARAVTILFFILFVSSCSFRVQRYEVRITMVRTGCYDYDKMGEGVFGASSAVGER